MAPERSSEEATRLVSLVSRESAREPQNSWKLLFSFTTRRHLAPLLVGLFFTVAGGLAIPLLAIILGRVFNELTKFGAGSITGAQLMSAIDIYCRYLLGLGSAVWLLQTGHFSLWIIFGELQAKRARDELFGELLRKETRWFDLTPDGVSALLPRIQANIRDLQIAVSQPLGSIFQNIAASITGLILALYISWSLTLVSLATVPICAIVISVISGRVQPEIDAQRRESDKASKSASNAVSSIDVVKQCNAQTLETDKYMSAIRYAAQHYFRQALFTAGEIGCIHFLTFGMFVQGFWYGGHLVSTGKLNPGQVLTTFWACLQATQAIEGIVPQLLVLEKGRAAAAALRSILAQVDDRHGADHSTSAGISPEFCNGSIKFHNVTFAYPSQPNRPILDDCSFFFPSGVLTFVVGKSGSGKSTLGNLLLRFYEPASGEISIDGRSILSLNLDWIRNNVTLVQQQSSLFNESVLRNIAFGAQNSANVKPNDILTCITFASLQETIEAMPDGLDTVVGLGGDRLSGGQRQRVALARSHLRNTPVLILDESTSALDHFTRVSIMDSIRIWRKGKTTIIITHDLSQIKDNDFVYTMENGKVSNQGYKRMVESTNQDSASPMSPISPWSLSHSTRKSYGRSFGRPQSFPASIDGSLDIPSRLPFSPSAYSPIFRQSILLQQTPVPVTISNQQHSGSYSGDISHLKVPKDVHIKEADLTGVAEAEGNTLSPSSEDIELIQPLYPQPPTPRPTVSTHRPSSISHILRTVAPSLSKINRLLLVLGFVAAFFHAAATPAFSFLFSSLLSTFYLRHNREKAALQNALGILGVSIGNGVASFWMHYLLERCGHAWVDQLRYQAISGILQQPRQWFEKESSSASTLIGCLDRNAEEMRNLVGRFAGFMFVAAVMMVMGTGWGMALCWKLTLVGCACAPVLYALTRVFEKISGYWEGRCNRAAEVVTGIFSETFLDIRSVRALTLESYFHRKLFRANTGTLSIGMKRGCYTGFMFGLSESAIVYVYALVFYYGAVLVTSLEYSTKAILTVFSLLLFSMGNVKAVLTLVPQISSSKDTATQVLRLARLPKDGSHEHKGEFRILHPVPIKFSNVNFCYPSQPTKPVLRNFSLTVNENTCTAIVGFSGSGKSTIASLLLALYPGGRGHALEEGSISLGDLNIREIHVPTLRSLIAIVPQRATIFPTSIRNNISYGLEESSFFNTLANVRAAAKAAGIDDFVSSLPDGYDTIIGDGGVGLSGGQAQRLVIARALIRRPRVLILDEATSSLDVESAALVKRTVSKLMGMRNNQRGSELTVIIITHAREMMEIADNVVVVDKGRVVEEGPFEALITRHGGELRRLLRVNEQHD